MRPLKAVYENDSEPYRLEYESSDIGVKENIVLEERPESNRFTFEFRLAGLTMRKDPVGGGFTFYDKDSGDIVGGIAAPYMNDATGEAYSEAITCELEEKEEERDTYLLTVIPDKGQQDTGCLCVQRKPGDELLCQRRDGNLRGGQHGAGTVPHLYEIRGYPQGSGGEICGERDAGFI